MAHHPLSYKQGEDAGMRCEVRDRLFNTSVEVIEFSCLLERSESTAKWGWLFRTYMQWHAVAFVLSELIVRPYTPAAERAWRAVNSVSGYTDHFKHQSFQSQNGMLWKPVRQLMAKARAHRARQLGLDPNKYDGVTRANPTSNEAFLEQYLTDTFIDVTTEPSILDLEGDMFPFIASPDTSTTATAHHDPSRQPDMPVQGSMHVTATGSDGTSDFLNWAGWDPGVGDFTVGSAQGIENSFPNMAQHEWF